MRQTLLLLAAVAAISITLFAQKPAWQPAPGHATLPVWPHAAPGAPPNPAPEIDTTTPKDNLIAGKPLIRLGNVSAPTLTLYAPTGKNTGAAVVVFPGGGYRILAIDLEGTEVCDWLNSAGITCVLLKYRVPDSGPYPKSAAALQDAQRALGIVRSHAAEWHIDSHRIGVLGFSAGAHLAAALSTHFDQRLYDPIDAADQLSCRPDFAVIVYPGYLALAEQNFAAQSRHPRNGQNPTLVHRPGRRRSGACRKRHRLLPRPQERQGSRRNAHLRPGRTRLRSPPHRAPGHHVAAVGGNLAPHHPGPADRSTVTALSMRSLSPPDQLVRGQSGIQHLPRGFPARNG